MTVCPFCKKAVPSSGGPCPSCGRSAPSKQPAAISTGQDHDEWDAIEHGAANSSASGASSYSGGTFGGLGDDEDNGPSLSLELDTPARPSGPVGGMAPMSGPSGAPPSMQPSMQPRSGASGQYQAFSPDAMPQAQPPRSLKPASDPSMYAQQSTPNSLAPPSSPQVAPQQAPMPPPMMSGPPGSPDAARMIARYPAPPAKVWESPIYAVRVLIRQLELRQDIASLKKRRSPDVALYERALKTHDGKSFLIGMTITCAMLTVATFIFFLPVILRFVRDP